MARLVYVSASDGTLWNVALRYLGDATQAGRIASINGLSDFWLSGFAFPVEIVIPDADAAQADAVPDRPGSDFGVLLGLVSGTPTGAGGGTSTTTGESLILTSIPTVIAGQPIVISGVYTGSPVALDYQIDSLGWYLGLTVHFLNGGFSLSIPGLKSGNYTLVVRDSDAPDVLSAPTTFIVSSATGGLPPPVDSDPTNDFGGDVEDMVILPPGPAPLGQFILGVNSLANDAASPAPPSGGSGTVLPTTSDVSPDIEALGNSQ